MPVTGTGIASGTTLAVSGSMVSLSQNATLGGTASLTALGGNNPNGFPAAITAAGTGGKVILDQPYDIPDPDEAYPNHGLTYRSQNYAAQQTIFDHRAAFNREYYYDHNSQETDGAKLFQHFHGSNPSATSESGFVSFGVQTVGCAPGTMNIGSESGGYNIFEKLTVTQKGTHQNRDVHASKYGIGDFGIEYDYINTFGGSINGDDEGVQPRALYVNEGNAHSDNIVPQALVTGTQTDPDLTQSLLLSPTQCPGQFGAGRFALLVKNEDGTDANLGTFTMTAQNIVVNGGASYAEITVHETLPVSNVWGQSTAPFDVPYNNDLPQCIVTTVQLQGGAGATCGGGFVCGIASYVGLNRKELVQITHVDCVEGTGPYTQTITVYVRSNVTGTNGQGVPAGAPMFFQDSGGTASGLIQSVLKVLYQSYGAGKNSLAYPILGVTDENTLILGTNMTLNEAGIYNFSVLLPDGSGRNTATAYRGAEVIRTLNPSASPTPSSPDVLGSYIGLEANSILWPTGCTVESPSHYSFHCGGIHLSFNTSIPCFASTALEIDCQGAIANSGSYFVGQSFSNNNPSSNYIGSGGYYTPPLLIKASGPWSTMLDFTFISTQSPTIIQLPEPLSGQAVNIFEGYTGTSGASCVLDYAANIMTMVLGSTQVKWDGTNDAITLYAGGGSGSIITASPVIPQYLIGMTTDSGGGTTAAPTLVLPHQVMHVNGTTPIQNVTPPPGWAGYVGGVLYVIADDVWSTISGGNIATVMTAVVGTLYAFVYDGVSWCIK